MIKRYLVVTYSRDIGSDERLDYSTMRDAIRAARQHLREEDRKSVV